MTKNIICILLFFLCSSCYGQLTDLEVDSRLMSVVRKEIQTDQRLDRIAVGSCNRQDLPQPLWKDIREADPNLWIWLGDNVYADTDNEAKLQKIYNQQLSNPDYQNFLSTVPVIGIWDDHDYGLNDGGKEFQGKEITKKWMLSFLGVPKDNSVYNHEGTYQSYVFGPKGQQVMIILLDSRSFRDPVERENGNYIPRDDGTMLGADQWAWLEKKLKESKAQVHLIANGIQFLPEEHRFEKWSSFPHERERLLNLITRYEVDNPVLLSGDRHLAEVSQLIHKGKTITELTSSGLTHPYGKLKEEPNRHRVGELVTAHNFGLLEIDWTDSVPQVEVGIRGLEGEVLERVTISAE